MASVMGAFNFSGDSEDSFWVQASLPLEALSSDDVEVDLTVGVGNGVYTTDTDPNLAQVSIDVSSGDYFARYILNPETEIIFLVFGTSFYEAPGIHLVRGTRRIPIVTYSNGSARPSPPQFGVDRQER